MMLELLIVVAKSVQVYHFHSYHFPSELVVPLEYIRKGSSSNLRRTVYVVSYFLLHVVECYRSMTCSLLKKKRIEHFAFNLLRQLGLVAVKPGAEIWKAARHGLYSDLNYLLKEPLLDCSLRCDDGEKKAQGVNLEVSMAAPV